jgi:hypothetical protein
VYPVEEKLQSRYNFIYVSHGRKSFMKCFTWQDIIHERSSHCRKFFTWQKILHIAGNPSNGENPPHGKIFFTWQKILHMTENPSHTAENPSHGRKSFTWQKILHIEGFSAL